MTGTLRATFNKLYDPLQGFSICTTGQCFLLQLAHDLQQVPTLDICSMNTDAILYTIEEEYKEQAHKVLHEWEELTGLELEEDKVVKIVMANVNNYCEIVQVGDNDYKVNYKGGYFNGIHNFKWNKEKRIFEYSFQDGIETNSLTIVSEALLKYLLFNIPVGDTINACNDIWRYQQISHLGSTYEKCVQESPNGDIELQRNNRIYASNKKTGAIIKVKYDGRRDRLANQPPNPIVDNANKCTIDDIDKSWYIKLAKQWVDDFRGVKRLTEYKKTELVEMANNMGIKFDPKIKKDDLIKLIEERNEVMCMEENKVETIAVGKDRATIAKKINAMKKEIMRMDFCLDEAMPGSLGGREYASIGQYYKTINQLSDKYGLLFKWEVDFLENFEKELFKPATGMPQHVATVRCQAAFIDIDTGDCVEYSTIASGSDTCDKAVSSASALAFRNWFDKNFTPKHLVVDEFSGLNDEVSESKEQTAPKVPTYIPPAKKEEITNKVVETVQHEKGDDDDIKEVINNIMKVRELSGNSEWGAKTLESLMSSEVSSADILEIDLKVKNKLESLEAK